MSFFKGYVTIFYYDIKRALWKIALVSLLLFIGIIDFTKLLDRPGSVADIFNYLFIQQSYFAFSTPILLFILYFVLQPFHDPTRLYRIKERKQMAIHIYWIVFVTVILFLSFYILIGFLYGLYNGGTLTNTWVTKEGLPYQLFGDEIDLSLFSTGNMVARFTLTGLAAFYLIGLVAAFLQLIFTRYIFVFLLIEGFLIFDGLLKWLFDFSLFVGKAEVKIGNWGNMASLIGNLAYFLGLIILFATWIFLILNRKDFLREKEGEG